MKEKIRTLYKHWFGEIQYIVSVLNVSGEVGKYVFTKIIDVHEFVRECNNERYWSIQKIEKIRVYDFIYTDTIIHSPLFFSLTGVTEKFKIRENSFSFPVQDKSLSNVIRVESKIS